MDSTADISPTLLSQMLLVMVTLATMAKFRANSRVVLPLAFHMSHLLTMPADASTNLMAVALVVFQMTSRENPHVTEQLASLFSVLSSNRGPQLKVFSTAVTILELLAAAE